eukprot:CAMPEP_0170619986 /NCGR_PEP_ID=MMETSP0224-20130122/27815_1 /TAXON_ID=285029 /ORGANISM="Togula jolla, Strain CCCM 725" /LENGTH=46 /DNA_ID= /DNA_START= /DNA_END= /DNA_ORIENTATION=
MKDDSGPLRDCLNELEVGFPQSLVIDGRLDGLMQQVRVAEQVLRDP